MDSRGYSDAQQKAMRSIMAMLGEYFEHGIVVIKDSGKEFYWDTAGDGDMVDILAYRAYEDITSQDEEDEESEEWEESD